MNIYLDDNRIDPVLVGMLQKAGHQVIVPSDANLAGASDVRHFEHAIRQVLVVLTADRDDFRELAQLVLTSGGSHPGILLVFFDNDAKRDMQPKHMAAAIRKLERSGMSLVNQVIVLNQWR